MIPTGDLRKYNKRNSYSYTFGMFPTFELLENKVQYVDRILLYSSISQDIVKKVRDIVTKIIS